jgi:hypothetical protein
MKEDLGKREISQKDLRKVRAEVLALEARLRQAGEHVSLELAGEAKSIIKSAREYLDSLVGPVKEVRDLMGNNFIGPEQYETVFRQRVEQVKLPKGILEILNKDCPIYKDGKKVHETHKLTLVPMQIEGEDWTLSKLFDLIRSKGENIINEDWIVKGKFTELSLKDLALFNPNTEKKGRYILLCDKVPEDTKNNQAGWKGTLKSFKKQYPNHRPGFSLELATGLLMHNRVSEMLGVEETLFSNEYGWCLDYLKKGYDGRVSSVALAVGYFFSDSLAVGDVNPANARSWWGSSALWNFQGNWDLDTGKLG